MKFDILIPITHCVEITSVIDTASIEEDSTFNATIWCSREAVDAYDIEILLGGIVICVDVDHGEEELSLMLSKIIDLFY